jgi:protein-tyrosine phosphatase
MSGFVDVHSHVVPSGDDGARTIEEGLELCRIALEAGTEILFATPHAHASWDTFPRTSARVELYETSLAQMRAEVAEWGLDLRRGWEVYPTEAPRSEPAGLVLEGTNAVLLEFPGSWLEIDDAIGVVAEGAAAVAAAGLTPVLAHPERCRPVAADPWSVRPLVEDGALLCLNAPSLVGRHGATAERTAWALLDAGLIALAASDGHSVNRPPALEAAYAEAVRHLGEPDARRLFDGSALPWV